MGRLRFVAGALGIIAGFFVYQYGFFLTLNLSPDLSSWSLAFVPWVGSVAVMGAALQLIGGAIAIAGLLVCITWVGSQSKTKLTPVLSLTPSGSNVQALQPVRRCKFCNEIMNSDTAFCPKCQRAQT